MLQRPSCEILVNEKTEEIFMSFGLLNAVARHVGDPVNIPLITLNADLREIVLDEMLAIRSKSGGVTQARKFSEIEISMEDCEKLLEFAADHVTDFMLRALEKANARKLQYEEKFKALIPSLNGPKA